MIFNFGGHPTTAGDAAAEAAHTQRLAQVRGYWEALRPVGRLPHRGAVDPRGMADALPYVFLAEEIAPGMARLRLAGLAVAGLMGMEVSGMPLSALFDPLSRRSLEGPVAQVFTGRHAVTADLQAETSIGRPPLSGRMILLPLEGFGGRPDLALGCLSICGDVGRTPRRLILRRAMAETLDVPQARVDGTFHLAAAEDGAPFQPARPSPATTPDEVAARRASIRLVPSD